MPPKKDPGQAPDRGRGQPPLGRRHRVLPSGEGALRKQALPHLVAPVLGRKVRLAPRLAAEVRVLPGPRLRRPRTRTPLTKGPAPELRSAKLLAETPPATLGQPLPRPLKRSMLPPRRQHRQQGGHHVRPFLPSLTRLAPVRIWTLGPQIQDLSPLLPRVRLAPALAQLARRTPAGLLSVMPPAERGPPPLRQWRMNAWERRGS